MINQVRDGTVSLPAGWTTVIMDELIQHERKITYGIVQPGSYDANGVFLVRGKDYIKGWARPSEFFKVSKEIELPYRRARLSGGDLIMSIAGDVGSVATVPTWLEGANITQTTARLAIDSTKASNQFYYYFFLSEIGRNVVRKYVKGSAQQGLNLKDVQIFKVIYPPLPEQRKIAAILSTVDETIEKTDAIIQETQQLKKGLMQKLFTEGIRHTRFKETKIGRIPEGWGIVSLGDVATIKRGISYDRTTLGDKGNGNPYINMKSFRKHGGYNPSGLKFFIGGFSKEDCVTSRDLLIVNTDLTRDGDIIGVPALLPTEFANRKVLYSHHVTSLGINESVSKQYIYYLLCSAHCRREMRRIARGTTVLMLDLKALRKLSILSPPLAEQRKIADILSEVDTKIEAEQDFKLELQQLKKALMQVLLTGKMRVRTNE